MTNTNPYDDGGKPHTGKFVEYRRVSTDGQGKSGLGLEAQEAAIQRYLNGGNWQSIGQFTEVESGRKTRVGRPELDQAIRLCQAEGATLVIAKLDRLGRNLHFVTALMESGIEFVCCDMPDANKFTIQIMAAMAEQEAELISKRTKEALARAKARGVQLGNPNAAEISKIAVKANMQKAQDHADNIYPIIKRIEASGIISLRGIARELNNRKDAPTLRGGTWSAQHVRKIFERCQTAKFEAMAPLDVIAALKDSA